MEKTNYEFARSLIQIFAFIGVAIGVTMALVGVYPLVTGQIKTLEFIYSVLTMLAGLVVAGVSMAIYEFLKAFLDLVDNSHVIKQQLLSKMEMGKQ